MAVARVPMAQSFIRSGLSKLGAAHAMRGCMEAMHLPGALPWPTIAVEIGAGLPIVLGYRTRIVPLPLTGFCAMTARLFHPPFCDHRAPSSIDPTARTIAAWIP